LQTLIIVIGLAAAVIVFLLIPALFGREERPSPSVSDSGDSHLNQGASLVDSEKTNRHIEYGFKDNEEKNTHFIKKLIWIVAIAVATTVVYYIASPYQNCLAREDKHWCSEHTIW
jgi:hypothetical protein